MTVQEVDTVRTELSDRLRKLPTYVFAWLDEVKAQARARGADLIDLGMGNPDQLVPRPILETIAKGVLDPANNGYPNFKGKPEFREAVAGFMKRRYNVEIDPYTEVQPLIGSKEGLAHLTFAYIGEGDVSLVPSPYYPVHSRATWLAGGNVLHLPLTAENNFLPDLKSIPTDSLAHAKLFFVNYPNNPTAACATLDFYTELVEFCRVHNIVLVSDLAYGEIAFDGYKPPSIFNVPGAKTCAIEFHSFSKSFSMAGFRVGWACGNADIVKSLYTIKTNLDYGVANAIQDGAAYALNHAEEFLPEICQMYQERRDVVVEGFRSLGWPVETTKASMYVWLPIPQGFATSKDWCVHLVDQADVVITPGIAFGDAGDRYFRVSLVSPKETLQKAVDRLKERGIRYE